MLSVLTHYLTYTTETSSLSQLSAIPTWQQDELGKYITGHVVLRLAHSPVPAGPDERRRCVRPATRAVCVSPLRPPPSDCPATSSVDADGARSGRRCGRPCQVDGPRMIRGSLSGTGGTPRHLSARSGADGTGSERLR